MKKILKYTSGLLFLLLILHAELLPAQDPGMRLRGPRIGYDAAGLALLYFEPERSIHTFSVDYEVLQDIYPVAEFGFQTVRLKPENYRYQSGGIFGRVGVDVNFLKYEETDVYEMMYAGFRYGISNFTQKAGNISIPDPYFGDYSGGAVPENQLNAHWISLVGGLKVKVFSNFFMGWSVLANLKLFQVSDANMDPYNIPGFGKGNRKTSVIINYTLSYRIPLREYKPKKIIKKRELPAE